MDLVQEQIIAASQDKTTLRIAGGRSKFFLRPEENNAPVLDMGIYDGIIEYRPEELVVTAGAGTSIATLKAAVAEQNQMLAFEPPNFIGRSTLGGTVATAMSGQASAYHGYIRDFVLGVEIINGHGQRCRFGGKVMKNVAGYDVARLLTGSFGTMAAITEVSFKVLPKFNYIDSYQIAVPKTEAIVMMQTLNHRHPEITGMMYQAGNLSYRVSANQKIDGLEGEMLEDDFWKNDAILDLPTEQILWRLRVPANTKMLDHTVLVDLGGTRRFIQTDDVDYIQKICKQTGGLAKIWGVPDGRWIDPLAPLKEKLKTAFDPHGIFV